MSCPAVSEYTHYGQDPTNHPDQKELTSILHKLDQPPLSYTVLNTDGVLRSLDFEHKVMDAVGLPPRLIKAFMDRWPYDKALEARFRGSDGTLVPQEQWWAPDPSILPAQYSTELKDQLRREHEERKDTITAIKQERNDVQKKRCGVVIRSDYKI